MDNYEQLKKLFKSSRYECDLFFYTEIAKILEDLSLYQLLPPVLHNKEIVNRVEELTKQHLRLLENDDNEEEALRVIKLMKTTVPEIDPTPIANIMQKIQSMGGKGYEQRIILLIKNASFKKPYLQICDRLINSIHDPAVRFRDLLIVGMFFCKNGQKVTKFVQIFKNVLQNAVQELRKFRQRKQFINSHSQIQENVKVTNYLKGSQILLKKVLRFNQIYRVLSGDNKFGLKINALKKQIQGVGQENRYTTINCDRFKDSLLKNEIMTDICSLCLEKAENDHKQCMGVLKLMYVPHNE